MRPIADLPKQLRQQIKVVVTDVDDTLTEGSRLSAATYCALENLKGAGFVVVPATAAPAGWCDLIARMWPISGIIGENGGLFFRHDQIAAKTERVFWLDELERKTALDRLLTLARGIEVQIPSASVALDQAYRQTTLAMTAPSDAIPDILREYALAGLRNTMNSLWALAWFGDFDKLTMVQRVLSLQFGLDPDAQREQVLYVGDSLNDGPQFDFFPNSVGVANVRQWLDRLSAPPAWVTEGCGGTGFNEVADYLLAG